jgi:hypothetical protein
VFIVEMITKDGNLCEAYETFAEASRRVKLFPAESLVGVPFIFQELPDGSQRLVREDGKPLQIHRLPEDLPPGPDEPLPLSEISSTDSVNLDPQAIPMLPLESEDEGIDLVDY